MVARNPNAAGPTLDGESALRFNRGLIIRDFLRLRAERSTVVPDVVRELDAGRLRQDGDGGRLSVEACAVVHFMSEYYGDAEPTGAAPPYLRGDGIAGAVPGFAPGAARVAPSTEPGALRVELAAFPVQQAALAIERGAPPIARGAVLQPAPLPAPEPVQRGPRVPAREPVRVASLAVAPLAALPAPEPAPQPQRESLPAVSSAPAAPLALPTQPTAIDAREVDERLRRAARRVILEIEAQLRVPRYLSFREARVRARDLSQDEIAEKREVSLRASERVISLLTTLSQVPGLRAAVQSSLGSDGRARIGEALAHTFLTVPDPEQRARALGLWGELEMAARSTESLSSSPVGSPVRSRPET